MKNSKYFIAIILFVTTLSAGFAFTPHRIEPVDIRAEGMGGPYYTDSESFYTLFTNPAGLAFTGDKTLWPTLISLGVGGPLKELAKLGLDHDSDFQDKLPELIGDSGFNFNARTGPLTFGAIRNNFGWGVVQTAYAEGNVPSLMKSDIRAGVDLGIVFGYAFPFDFGALGKLSVGVSGRGITQIEAVYTESLTSLIDKGFDLNSTPLNLTFGFGFDIGVQYEVLDLIHVALVWQDAYTATWTSGLDISGGYNDHKSDYEYNKLESKLGIGVGIDIPLEKITKNVISHLGVYANYNNLWPLFNNKDEVYRNPWLELSIGTELVLFDVVALRFGMNEMYFSSGFGLYLGVFRMDFSIYGRELGSEPGYSPQLNAGMAMTIQY